MKSGRPTCFVIMPFGMKPVGNRMIDFDAVWDHFLKPAGERAEFRTFRADSEAAQAHISETMIKAIYEADVAIADVTYHNPNVFYELGMRHALSRHGSILVKRGGGERATQAIPRRGLFGSRPAADEPKIPFDVQDIAHFFYDFVQDKAEMDRQIGALADCIRARHNATDSDSPVFKHIPTHRVTTGSSRANSEYNRTFELLTNSGEPTGKYTGYRAGDIAKLEKNSGRQVDYWVNSENTQMEMARMAERAMSSTIRYLGARDPDPNSPGFDDTIQRELKATLGNRSIVPPGTILVTDSGRLRETHDVKAILHAASVIGKPRGGFDPISVDDTLEMIETIISQARALLRADDASKHGTRLIMPLFGTGQAGRDPVVLVGRIVQTVRSSLLDAPTDLSGRDLTHVLFSAFSNAGVKLMRRIFSAAEEDGLIRRVSTPSSMPEDPGDELD